MGSLILFHFLFKIVTMSEKSKLNEADFIKERRGEHWDGVPGYIRHYRSTANCYEPGLPSLRTTHVAPYIAPKIERGKNYTDNMIGTQQTSLENLRFAKRQLTKDDRELRKLQAEINELTSRSFFLEFVYLEKGNEQ